MFKQSTPESRNAKRDKAEEIGRAQLKVERAAGVAAERFDAFLDTKYGQLGLLAGVGGLGLLVGALEKAF